MKDIKKNSEWLLKTSLPVSFEIKYVDGVLNHHNKELLGMGSQGNGARRIVVVDKKVSGIYLKDIIKYFKKNNIKIFLIVVDATEKNKHIKTLLFILEEIEKFGLSRKSEPIIAIGGGVLLDIVGFAANLYRRGVPYIKIPTTLLALVDASVGVKTGVNFKGRRNRLGTYYPPIAVYLDTHFLKTLEPLEISSGLGEILKMAVVKDKELFTLLQKNGKTLLKNKNLNCKHSKEVINRSVDGMKCELQENLWEKNLERYVDFGHSFSPIPEIRSLTDDNVASLTHGQAVTLDVIFSSIISYLRGMLSKKNVLSIMETARNLNLPTTHPYFMNSDILMEALSDTVKHRNGSQNLPIPKDIGNSIFINDLTYENIRETVQMMKSLNNEISK